MSLAPVDLGSDGNVRYVYMVAHDCHPALGSLRREDDGEFEVSVGQGMTKRKVFFFFMLAVSMSPPWL